MLINMKKMLSVANEHNFAVPAFNISDYSMLNGIFEVCEETRSPVIIATGFEEIGHMGYEASAAIREKAVNASIPVVLHLDHGASFAEAAAVIRHGYTSVMIDGSMLPYEENIALCKKVAELAHVSDVSVEGELGTIGATSPQNTELSAKKIIFTDPDTVEDFISRSGIDSLAVAIGTSHGLYPKDAKPKLQIELLRQIKAKAAVPLVLHGGSSNLDTEIAAAVDAGINKINISSDIKLAYFTQMQETLKTAALTDPIAIHKPCVEAMKAVAAHKIRLFKADGKAELYTR